MSEIKFNCPHCMGNISAGQEWFGKSTGCPHCNRLIQIPLPPTGPLTHVVETSPPRPPGRIAVFVKQRKPFVITIFGILLAFLALQIHLRTKPEPKPDRIVTSTPVISDDPFVLSNGYRVSRTYRTGADGRLHEFTDRESLEKWQRQEAGIQAAESEKECSICKGTGRFISRSVLKCSSCSGQGTRLTPSGHRMICSDCGGTGIAKQDGVCIYCQGTGKVR